MQLVYLLSSDPLTSELCILKKKLCQVQSFQHLLAISSLARKELVAIIEFSTTYNVSSLKSCLNSGLSLHVYVGTQAECQVSH